MSSPKNPAFFLCAWEVADISAVQALERGDASPEQQKRALNWIIRSAAATYDNTFFPGQPDASAFSAGRRFVGLELVKLLHLNPSAFIKDKHNA